MDSEKEKQEEETKVEWFKSIAEAAEWLLRQQEEEQKQREQEEDEKQE